MQMAVAQTVDDLLQAGEERILQAQAQQDEIESIADATQNDLDDYVALQREIANLRIYNEVLQIQVDNQLSELATLNKSIDEVDVIERQILPLMTRMITSLKVFIDLDVPFLLDERYERVEKLRTLMTRSDVTPAEQIRNVLEAWVIEMDDYGPTIEVYTDDIEIADGTRRQVQLLRIGRVALLYITPDNSQAGAWDQRARKWVRLEDSMVPEIRIGIQAFETKQAALFLAPVPPPEEN